MDILSFFSGCGGLDLGFEKAGFNVVWANDNAASIRDTYIYNFPRTHLSQADINSIEIDDLPANIIGIIGGPPCQSWSNAGKGLGFQDPRGKVFLTFISILKNKNPLFFVAENVRGIMAARNKNAYDEICKTFDDAGYDLSVKCLNAANYQVPQNRERVFFIGFRKDLKVQYSFPAPISPCLTVEDAIADLQRLAVKGGDESRINAHEYWEGGYSYIFMSRNRVLDWHKPAYTIQASGRQTAIHPQAPFMEKVQKDVCRFIPNKEKVYRRLTVRECARIQTFPDDFKFLYKNLNDGYKMVGNAVPVMLAYHIAKSIKKTIEYLL